MVILQIKETGSFNQFPNVFLKTATFPLSVTRLSSKFILLTRMGGCWDWMSRTKKNSCLGEVRQVNGILVS